MEKKENDKTIFAIPYFASNEMDKSRKTNVIFNMENCSVELYSKKNYRKVNSADYCFYDSIDEIMEEYGIENNVHNLNVHNLYDIIANSENTITMYEILEWFNEQYKNIKKEAHKLPKLEFFIKKWEIDSLEKVSFVFDRLNGRRKDEMTLHFVDENEKLSDFFHRKLFFSSKENAAFMQYINALFHVQEIDEISKELIREYLELSKKYLDYLNAYQFLKKPEPTNISNKYYYNGIFDSSIYGNDPFRNLDKVMVGVNRGGNVDSYFFTYKLGGDRLEDPIMYFYDCHNTDGKYTIQDIK